MGAVAAAVGVGLIGAAPASAGNGGIAYVDPPQIKAVKCVSSCMPGGRVQSGGKLALRGSRLAGVKSVVFRGGRGRRDDVTVAVRPRSDRSLAVAVPMRAQSGRLSAVAGRVSANSRAAVKIMPPAAPEPNAELSPVPGAAEPGAPALETATSRALFAIDQRGGVRFSFRVGAAVPAASLKLSLVRLDDGVTVKTWEPAVPADGEVGSVSWNGLVGSTPAPDGRYAFRLVALSAGGATAVNADAADARRDAFDLRPALFPIKGAHNYGQSGARFGAGRSGHSHQGQDVMAKCGTPLIAARGGVVKTKAYHSRAGNYLVIDGAATGTDYAYMHMVSPSAYSEGDRVRTGDQIGLVGTTGSSSACHLHFEMWGAPGWYTGGKPFDPLAELRAWDSYS